MTRHRHLPPAVIPFLVLTAASFAGPSEGKTPMPTPPAAPNPLSFFDGKLVFDVQEKMRFESRENNFDFNDSVDSLTDDSWILNRFRW